MDSAVRCSSVGQSRVLAAHGRCTAALVDVCIEANPAPLLTSCAACASVEEGGRFALAHDWQSKETKMLRDGVGLRPRLTMLLGGGRGG